MISRSILIEDSLDLILSQFITRNRAEVGKVGHCLLPDLFMRLFGDANSIECKEGDLPVVAELVKVFGGHRKPFAGAKNPKRQSTGSLK